MASEELEIGYVGDACRCIIPEGARKHGGRDEIVRQWDGLTRLCNLRLCYNIALEQATVSGTAGWDHVKKLVEKVAVTECAEALKVVEDCDAK